MLPPPPLEASHVATQFLPRVGRFVSNEICNRKPATLGHAPPRKSTSTGSNVSYGGDPVNFFSFFFSPQFFVVVCYFHKNKMGKFGKIVCVCFSLVNWTNFAKYLGKFFCQILNIIKLGGGGRGGETLLVLPTHLLSEK
jgi:hypothetical protein